MKTFLSTLLFLGVMAGNFTSFAQTPVTVGTGTSASGANVLFSTHTGGNLWSKSASLYTAGEIISAGGTAGNITKISFNKQGAGEYTFGDAHLNIYIKAVSKSTQSGSSLDWSTNLAGATPPYSTTTQSFMLGTGWQEFNLATPFFWDGSSNIEVLTAFHHPTTLTANMTWQYTVATNMNMSRVNSSEVGSQTLFLQSNRPNIKFTIAPAGPCTAPPTAGVAAASVTTICPNTNFNLSLTGNSLGTGQTYQWQSAPAATGPWTNIGTPSVTTSLSTSQVTTSFYRMAVTCSGQTAFSNSVQVVTNGIPTSGTFTINKNAPASATNFQSFAAAITSIECGGVNGAVVFNVIPGSGPYNEQVLIPVIPGASATNTITFNGNNNVLTSANTASNRAVLRLDGADFITISNLNIQAPDLVYGWGIHLLNGANNNSLINNTITISSTSTTEANSVGVVLSNSTTAVITAGNTGNNNLISGNTITGGFKGVHVNGEVAGVGSNQVINNTIKDIYSYGIEVSAANNTLVSGNDISRPLRATVGTFYGIYLSSGSVNTNVTKNRIHNTNDVDTNGTVYPLYITATDAPVGSENVFSNNLIYNINTTGTAYAIYNSNSNGAHYYHNIIDLNHAASTGVVRGVYQTGAASNIRLINNIFTIAAGTSGVKTGLYFATATTTFTSNNNVLFVAGNYGYSGSIQATLANWRTATGQDLNSVSVDPLYTNRATADFTPTNVAINNIGQAGTSITTDINGLARNPNAPDPGAYEFLNLTNDVGITAITSPTSVCGLTATETVTVVLTNFGTVAQSNIPVSYTLNNGTPVTAVIPGPLAPGGTITFSFPATVNLSATGAYTFVAQTNLTGDLQPNNNSTTKVVSNSAFTTLPIRINFETPQTGLGTVQNITNANSALSENAAASHGASSTKGLIMEGIDNPAWVLPVGIVDPWSSNAAHFSAIKLCFTTAGGNPNDPLWLSFDLKQLFKTANANTNFRVTVNGTAIGGNTTNNSPANTYRPTFSGVGGTADWTKIYLDLSAYKNQSNIELSFESNVKEGYANGTGTANLIDNIQILRSNPTGVKDNVLAANLEVYPNPSAGLFSVSVPTVKAYSLEVTDLTGKVILKQAVKGNASQLDLKGNAQGVYLLKITSEGNTAIEKLIIQ